MGDDVDYGDALRLHIAAALRSVVDERPADPFKVMQKILFAASLTNEDAPAAAAPSESAEVSAYMKLYQLQDAIDSCLQKMAKRLTVGPKEGLKFIVSDAGDFFT